MFLSFHNFIGMLDITEGSCKRSRYFSYKLTGSTPSDSRQEMTRAFNQGSRDAFDFSKSRRKWTELTGADTVILIDTLVESSGRNAGVVVRIV